MYNYNGDVMKDMNQIFSKIFIWMFIGLALTFGVAYYVSMNENMLYNIFSKGMYWILLIAEFGTVIFLTARIRKMQPTTAKFCFLLYSFLTGLTFSAIFVVYELTSIIYVFGLTSVVFLIFGLVGYYTKLDLTKLSTYLFMGLIAIILVGIINMFVGNETLNLGLCILGIVIFVGYTAYDIQVIKRGMLGIPDEDNLAIYGALQLYLDFINLFIRLLELFGRNRD